MTNYDLIRAAFENTPIHSFFDKQQIKHKLKTAGMSEGSINPADYCYNRINQDKASDSTLLSFNIFRYVDRGQYEYLGENYPFSGPVIYKPKGPDPEKVIGHLRDGVFFPNTH